MCILNRNYSIIFVKINQDAVLTLEYEKGRQPKLPPYEKFSFSAPRVLATQDLDDASDGEQQSHASEEHREVKHQDRGVITGVEVERQIAEHRHKTRERTPEQQVVAAIVATDRDDKSHKDEDDHQYDADADHDVHGVQ